MAPAPENPRQTAVNVDLSEGSPDPIPPADAGDAGFRRLLPRFVAGLVLAIVVLSGLTLFGDARQLAMALRDFRWWLVLPILGLTLWNYALRFVKWQLYLRALDLPDLSAGTSGLVFLSGFSMSITPGKVGELIKAVLLRRLTGAPVNRTSAIIAAERITDGLAMIALAAIGLTQFNYGRPFLALAAILAVAAVLLLQRPHLLAPLLARAERLPVVGPAVVHAAAFLDASNALLRPRLLVIAVVLGTVSWAGGCVAFYLVLIGLGLPASLHILLVATFVLAVSSIVGAVSMLPGGLGLADASVAGMLIILVTAPEMSHSVAAAATLLIRFATLWFAVLLGLVALSVIRKRLARQPDGTFANAPLRVEPGAPAVPPDGAPS